MGGCCVSCSASPAAEDEGSQGLQKAASCLGILCAIVMFGWVEPAHAHFDYFTGVKTTVRLGDFGLASIGSQKPKQRGDASLSKLFQKTKTVIVKKIVTNSWDQCFQDIFL